MSAKPTLTKEELDFLTGYHYEVTCGDHGIAYAWLEKMGAGGSVLSALLDEFNREMDLPSSGGSKFPPKPEVYAAPWVSLQELEERNRLFQRTCGMCGGAKYIHTHGGEKETNPQLAKQDVVSCPGCKGLGVV